MDKETAIQKMNELGTQKKPFFFMINFDQTEAIICDPNKTKEIGISFSFHNKQSSIPKEYSFNKLPFSYIDYKKEFDIVHNEIKKGNSYLTNLTCKTPINTNLTLSDIYAFSVAPYKLFFRDKFVVYSPETFVRIVNNKIYSYPMKGTIDANIENAKEKILADKKEAAEHATITDLIRNDLSIVATNVIVEKYRYIDKIKTNLKDLLQVSSIISGDLPENYNEILGSLIFKLLPAGSISGAPKQKTINIINKAESYKRGFYTGIFGLFDGESLDSAVMIRFIEKENDQFYYKSGGGITINSKPEQEYNEIIDKIYLPF